MVLLRRDDDAALELRVNGVFVMDTTQISAERELASRALAAWRACHAGEVPTTATASAGRRVADRRPDGTPARVLVGGLGLGFTLQAVLEDPGVREVVAAEIEPNLAAWHRAALIPQTAGCLSDPRVQLEVADVAEVVGEMRARSVDVLLLDVDNGPGYLVYDGNAALYRRPFLRTCAHVLSHGGVLAIWSAETSPALSADLAAVFDRVEEISVSVLLGRRRLTYTLLLALVATVP
jgi:predicted methyltransferase